MRRRRFRHSRGKQPVIATAAMSALEPDWQAEFQRLKEIDATLDQRMSDWAEERPPYDATHLLPSYAMDRRYDIFMEPRIPGFAEQHAQRQADAEEQPLVLEDPAELIDQIESAVHADDRHATAGSRRAPRRLIDPDQKRRRGLFRRMLGLR